MGKRGKQGGALRAKKRADAAALQLVSQAAEDVDNQTAKLKNKADDELFVIDTVGNESLSNKKNKRKSADGNKKSKKHRISEKDERQIKKLISSHGTEGVVELNEQSQSRLNQKKKSKRLIGTAKATFDLWDEDDSNKTKKTVLQVTGAASMGGLAPSVITTVSKHSLRKDIQQPANISNKIMKSRRAAKMNARPTVAVEIAQPGQSYCPDVEYHQDTIGEALNIEIRRNEVLDYNKIPIANNGLSEETMKIMVSSSDDDSEDSESDDDEMSVEGAVMKKKEKFTIAERNKQKRVREEQRQLTERKREKKFLSSLSEARSLEKKLRKEQVAKQIRRDTINALKEEERSKPLGINVLSNRSNSDPLYVPALPVALSEEVKDAGLRTVKPKGSLLTDRVQSMMARKMIYGQTKVKKAAITGKKRKMRSGKHREFLLT
uniref:Ribosome biogenesis protein NOP53 n=1 Tax=Eucampia antarctica TaxID=49252 RepID=A0A7S2WR68_9STRA|mmetsp:Transcript_9854/g.9530  ORF Transcript_9854/g.9530 Transcript_9854/m.9530 type:complete len:435 (+) Transcript_9854:36-1340(+)